jgi:GntR family transcriptional regulator
MAPPSRKTHHPGLAGQGVALYLKTAAVLRARIVDGTWKSGDRISTIEQMERELGVGRVTIRQAIACLYEEGLLRSHQGKGTFVTGPARDPRLEVNTDWRGLLAPVKENVPHILDIRHGTTPELHANDGWAAPSYVRLRSVQTRRGEPFAVACVHLAASVYRKAPKRFQKRIALALLADLEEANIANASQSLQVGTADLETARYLGISAGAPTLEARCAVRDHHGFVIYAGEITYRADRVRINIELNGGAQPGSAFRG